MSKETIRTHVKQVSDWLCWKSTDDQYQALKKAVMLVTTTGSKLKKAQTEYELAAENLISCKLQEKLALSNMGQVYLDEVPKEVEVSIITILGLEEEQKT